MAINIVIIIAIIALFMSYNRAQDRAHKTEMLTMLTTNGIDNDMRRDMLRYHALKNMSLEELASLKLSSLDNLKKDDAIDDFIKNSPLYKDKVADFLK